MVVGLSAGGFAENRTVTRLEEFMGLARRAIDDGSFGDVVLSAPRDGGSDLRSVRLRRIEQRGQPALSFVHHHATRDVTVNHGIDAGLAAVRQLLAIGPEPGFTHATLHAGADDWQWRISRKGKESMVRSARTGADPSPTPGLSHDRVKRRALSLELPFLVDLGLTDAEHRLVPSMARKWKQIDKFLEVLDGALDDAAFDPGGPLRIVDFGAGKGYLTFAVHAHLRERFGQAPQVTGVELRQDLVDLCNRSAERWHCEGLRFVQGDLRSIAPEAVDVMIALHACDTATDHAIALGWQAGARVLVCSPCCHKELRPQMATPPPLRALLRHGIHLGQEAEMVTDSLRALLLESVGYSAKVFEFVSLEHTGKNKMILATRRGGADAGEGSSRSSAALGQVADVKAFYGIREQCLERLIRERAAPPVTGRE